MDGREHQTASTPTDIEQLESWWKNTKNSHQTLKNVIEHHSEN